MKKRSTGIVILISAVCILVATAFAAAHFAKKDYAVLVNGSPVYGEEFQMMLKEHTISYETRLRENHGIPPEQSVRDYLGEEEYRRLMFEENVKLMTSLRVEQELGREYGIMDEFTYPSFLSDLEAENKSRADKIAKGEPVYGLQRFSPEQYYSYLMSNLRQQLLRELPDELLGVSGADVDAYYRGLKTYSGADGETMHYTLYDVTAAQALPAETQSQLYGVIAATMVEKTYLEIAASGSTYPPEKRAFTPNELRNFVRQDFSGEFLLGLATDEVCGPFPLGDFIYMAQYNGFEKAESLQEGDRAGFENTLREEAYEILIAQKATEATVKANQNAIIKEEET